MPPQRRTPGKYRVQDSRKPSGAGRHTKHRERGRRLPHSPGRTTPHTGAAGGFFRTPGIAMHVGSAAMMGVRKPSTPWSVIRAGSAAMMQARFCVPERGIAMHAGQP